MFASILAFLAKEIPSWVFASLIGAVIIACMWFYIRMQSAEISSYKGQLQTIASTYTSVYNAAKKRSDEQLAALKAEGQKQVEADNQKIAQIQADANNEINAIENAPKSPCLDQAVPDVIIEQFLTAPATPRISILPIHVSRIRLPTKAPFLSDIPPAPLNALAVNMPSTIVYVPSDLGENQ